MNDLLRSLRKNQRLVRDFVSRDLRGRYVGSSMGFFWSVIFPIINLFVYMFVFRLVLKVRFSDNMPASMTALLMLAGITVWSSFAETISRTTNTLVENQNLIQKVVFPSEVLPVYLTISSLINMCIGIPIVLAGVAWFRYLAPAFGMESAATAGVADANAPPMMQMALGLPLIVLPLLFALQAVFMLGLGYFFATLNLYLRDIYHLMGVFITVWMFATPIFYPAEKVEIEGYGWVLQINPMHWLISAYRSVLLYGQWPDWLMLLRFAVIAAVLFLAGSSFFMAQKPRFPDLL